MGWLVGCGVSRGVCVDEVGFREDSRVEVEGRLVSRNGGS